MYVHRLLKYQHIFAAGKVRCVCNN